MVKVVTLGTHRALEKLYPWRDCANWYLQLSIYQFSTVRAGIAGHDRPGVAQSAEMALGRLFNIPKGPNLHITNDIDLLAPVMVKHPELETGIVPWQWLRSGKKRCSSHTFYIKSNQNIHS
jgi:hypothetical protein